MCCFWKAQGIKAGRREAEHLTIIFISRNKTRMLPSYVWRVHFSFLEWWQRCSSRSEKEVSNNPYLKVISGPFSWSAPSAEEGHVTWLKAARQTQCCTESNYNLQHSRRGLSRKPRFPHTICLQAVFSRNLSWCEKVNTATPASQCWCVCSIHVWCIWTSASKVEGYQTR